MIWRQLVWLCLIVSQGAWALTVTTDLDRDTVDTGEPLVVTFEVDEQVAAPDFTPFERDFEIVNRSFRQSLSVGSGGGVRLAWSLTLLPKRSGEFTLPRIAFGSERSESLQVTVRSAPGLQGDDVYVEYSVDDPTPHVNQQVLLTTRVYTAVTVEDLKVSAPHVVNGRASLQELGSVREFHSVRGGRRYAVLEQRYTLVPERPGELVLSRLAATGVLNGARLGVRSDRLEIQVVDPAAEAGGRNAQPGPEDLFIDIEVDNRAPYVQEQVLYTIRLYRTVPIENANLSNPEIGGGEALIERIGRDRRYQTLRDERRYAVVERRYAVFPQTAGTVVVQPVELRAAVPLPSGGTNTTGFWNQPLTTPVRIESQAVTLEVMAPPAGAPEPWLPARRLTLKEQWPDDGMVEVGTPLSRRVELAAEGLLASQLPDLELDWPATFKSYAEQPVRTNDSGEQGVKSKLLQSTALIPAEPGTVTVPEFELTWWNTRTNSPETVRLPERTVDVAGPAAAPAEASPAQAVPSEPETSGAAASAAAWWVSAALAIAWLSTLLLWLRDRRAISAAIDGSAGANPAAVPSRRRAEKRLLDTCRGGNPQRVRDALLDWGRACWPESPPRSLGAVASRGGGDLASQIGVLQRALYAPGGTTWRGEGLARAVKSFRPDEGRRAAARGDALKPLYEH